MKVWIYLDGRQQGPFELEELAGMPGVNENTKVWFEGLVKWYPAGSLEQMRPLFDGTLARHSAAQSTQVEACTEHTVGEESYSTTESTVQQESQHGEPQVHERYYAPQSRYAPGQPAHAYAGTGRRPDEPCPPTHLGWSVFLLICCCSPLSIAGIVASIMVSNYYNNGRLEQARRASDVAAWLVMLSFALGTIPMLALSALL